MLSRLKSGEAAEEGVGILRTRVCVCVHPMCTRVCVQAPQPSQANSVGTHPPWTIPTTLNNNKPGFPRLVEPRSRRQTSGVRPRSLCSSRCWLTPQGWLAVGWAEPGLCSPTQEEETCVVWSSSWLGRSLGAALGRQVWPIHTRNMYEKVQVCFTYLKLNFKSLKTSLFLFMVIVEGTAPKPRLQAALLSGVSAQW